MKRKKRSGKFLDVACILFQRGFVHYVQEWETCNRTKLSWKCLYGLWVPFSSVGHILYSKNYLHLCLLLKIHVRFLLVCFSTLFSRWWASESSNHPEFQTSFNGWQKHLYIISAQFCALWQKPYKSSSSIPLSIRYQEFPPFFPCWIKCFCHRVKDVWNSRWLEDSKAH